LVSPYFIEGLEKLQARLLRRDPKLKLEQGPALVNRALGRLTGRTTRASKFYSIAYERVADTAASAGGGARFNRPAAVQSASVTGETQGRE